MWDSLSLPGSDVQTTIAGWTAVAAFATTVTLFCATLALRLATITRARRRAVVVDRWRGVLVAALLSETEARECRLPRARGRDREYVLEEWNGVASTVEGESMANLVVLAERLELGRLARTMLHKRGLGTRLLAIQTLGHLRDRSVSGTLVSLLDHPNTALSATAAQALVQIDARSFMPQLMQRVVERRDWPPASVFRILKTAGPALVTQPLCNAILTSDPETSVRLLRFSELARTETIDQLIELLLRERDEPSVLSAALAAISSQGGIPRLTQLARHEAWFVRVQAAKLLGRVGEERDLPVLEKLLSDPVWWARYRAAQAIVALPFMGPNTLRSIRDAQSDPFAEDMMRQAMAEVGLQ